jgi:hypothetical protein
MEEILHQLKTVVYPITDIGFQPILLVVQDFFHPVYYQQGAKAISPRCYLGL